MLNRIRNRFRNSGNGPWLFASVVVVALADRCAELLKAKRAR